MYKKVHLPEWCDLVVGRVGGYLVSGEGISGRSVDWRVEVSMSRVRICMATELFLLGFLFRFVNHPPHPYYLFDLINKVLIIYIMGTFFVQQSSTKK